MNGFDTDIFVFALYFFTTIGLHSSVTWVTTVQSCCTGPGIRTTEVIKQIYNSVLGETHVLSDLKRTNYYFI